VIFREDRRGNQEKKGLTPAEVQDVKKKMSI